MRPAQEYIYSIFKHSNVGKKVTSGSFDGTLYNENSDDSFATISEMMEENLYSFCTIVLDDLEGRPHVREHQKAQDCSRYQNMCHLSWEMQPSAFQQFFTNCGKKMGYCMFLGYCR